MCEEIKKNDILVDVFTRYPIIREVYLKNGFHCVGCDMSDFDTIGESLQNHNVENITEFLNYLNRVKDKDSLEED